MSRTCLSSVLVWCFISVVPALAWAAEEVPTEPSFAPTIFRSVAFLVVALFALVAAERWSRRVGTRSAIPVLARVSIAPKESLTLVDAGGRFLLLATGAGATTLVAELDEDQAALVQARKPLRRPSRRA